ncbi:hypothetical protein DRE_06710 [Drechslerella stenobrocha 248]|uniref:ER membrane protein complex subunit 1 n=1 Tax=Drechslerella stenobrocha 248 TaxID=1043628 RepID=W7HXB3_9PEZI|nr:hypothetical protein DRE_06710 [Drechslerella stenobrocha 248]
MWMRHNPLHYLLLAGCLVISPCQAVFKDEAFHTDFQLQLFGTPLDPSSTFFHQAAAGKVGSLLYTLSNRLVIGAINPKDGSQVWRQQLGQGTVVETEALSKSAFLRKSKDGRVVSVFGKTISLWDAATGRAIWEFSSSLEVADVVTAEPENQLVVAFKNGDVKAFQLGSGGLLWENVIGKGQDAASNLNLVGDRLYLTLNSPSTSQLKTVAISPVTGTQLEEFNAGIFGRSDAHVLTPQLLPLTSYRDSEHLKLNLLGTKHTKSIEVDSDVHDYRLHAVTTDLVFIEFWAKSPEVPTSWADFYTIKDGSLTKVLDLPYENDVNVFSLSDSGSGIYATRISRSHIRVYDTESNTPVTRFEFPKLLPAQPLHVVTEVAKRRDGAIAVRAAITLADGNVILVRNGEIVWTRQEALASAVAAEFVDIHEVEDSLERALHAEEVSNVVTAYLKRVARHINDLKYLPAWIARFQQSILGIAGIGEKPTSDALAAKDTFGFRKFVVFVTRFGWVTAIDTANQGQVVWTLPLAKPEIMEKDIKGILHFGKGVVVVVLSSGDIFKIDAVSGKGLKKSSFSILPSASVMTVESTTTDQRWIIAIPGKEGAKGWYWPDQDENELGKALTNITISRRCENRGGICGYTAKPTVGGRLLLTQSWSFRLPTSQKIVSVTTRPAHDPIASIGKVLGDRSVLYKYVNSHLALVIASTESSSTVYIYLLDSVSGVVLHTSTQADVDTTRPVVATMAENWYVYSYYSKSTARGTHIVVTDLFASPAKNDPGRLMLPKASSYDQPRSTSPYAMSQAFVFPHSISALATTTTRQGITTRAVLLAAPQLGSLLSINKRVLDPRRPVGRDPNNDEKEEGLFKYEPFLGVDHQRGSLSHSREVIGVKSVITTPSLLESTSVVVAWGLDIFGTRTSPSEAFDILGRGFNKLTLILSVVAVGFGTLFMRPMVRKKQINQRWTVN